MKNEEKKKQLWTTDQERMRKNKDKKAKKKREKLKDKAACLRTSTTTNVEYFDRRIGLGDDGIDIQSLHY